MKDLNDLKMWKCFSTFLRGGKAFAAEQKIRELKTRISELFSQKLKMSTRKIIEMSTINMNIRPSKKYDFSPQEVEKRALESERFGTVYNMHRLEKTNKLNLRQDRYNKKKVWSKTKKTNRKPQHWRKTIRLSGKNKEKECTRKILQAAGSKHKLFQQRHCVYHKKKTSRRQYSILLDKKSNSKSLQKIFKDRML